MRVQQRQSCDCLAVFSKDGILPGPKKVSAIEHAPCPTNASELRSFLGMTNYFAMFISDYATICEPLRRLTQQDGFGEKTKYMHSNRSTHKLPSDTVITYFDPQQNIDVIVDASPVRLEATMAQEGEQSPMPVGVLPIQPNRKRNPCSRMVMRIFYMYIGLAHNVFIITDHKPLERIGQKPKPLLRIERWELRLKSYKLMIKYESQYPRRYVKTPHTC